MARQKLGQHFLSDTGWRDRIAQAIQAYPQTATGGPTEPDWCWVEVGAGHGEMTEHLLDSGKPVIAVEIDKTLVERLNRLAGRHPNLTVVAGDILQLDLRATGAGRRLRIYGNLPYYITSPILHRFFEVADRIDAMHIVIQQEVAERLVAEPGHREYGYLSVATQFYTRPSLALAIPPDAFEPPPQVDSALVSMQLPGDNARLGIADSRAFLDFVKMCFAQKRKTLVNNFRAVLSPDATRLALQGMSIREDARAEQLSVTELAGLYRTISSLPTAADPDNRT